MEWTDEVWSGAWIRERLDTEPTSSMHGVVPRGFDDYARILHRPHVAALPGRSVPTPDEWMRMPEPERHRLSEAIIYGPTTWADAGTAFGTAVHAGAQWNRLVRASPEDGGWQRALAPDGREFEAPALGRLDADLVALVAGHLSTRTTTPDDVHAAVWDGWGGLTGFFGETPARTFLQLTSDEESAAPTEDERRRRAAEAAVYDQHNAMLGRSIHDAFNTVLGRPTWQPGTLSDRISLGARLQLPGRDHILFRGSIRELAAPDWTTRVPWADAAAGDAESPSIVWPHDRAWVMVTDVDFDSTIVGGSPELIRSLVRDPGLEALRIEAGADLGWDADEVNR